MNRTIVVGGGPAGLAAAYRLTQYSASNVLLLERDSNLGGIAAGLRYGPHTLDFGPHRLHPATDPEVLSDLRCLLGEELETRPRRGQIRLDGRYLPYPISPTSLVRLGLRNAAILGAGALAARIAHPSDYPNTYAGALVKRLGKPLYRLFYGPYAEKVWGLPGNRIAADQAERRVNQRGLVDLLRGALAPNGNRSYLYPRGGFGRVPAVYAQALASTPDVQLNYPATVDAIAWGHGRVLALRHTHQGRAAHTRADHLIWTAPLGELVRRLEPAAPAFVRRAIEHLRYRAVVLCYLVLAVPRVGSADTYYFPEQSFPFNRVTEQKNFGEALVPPDRTVLCLDITCDPADPLVTASAEQLKGLVVPPLERARLIRGGQVIEVFSRCLPEAYPVYDLGYDVALRETLDWLSGLENLWPIGRHGIFLHNNTHHSLAMGYRAADAVLRGRRAGWADVMTQFANSRVSD